MCTLDTIIIGQYIIGLATASDVRLYGQRCALAAFTVCLRMPVILAGAPAISLLAANVDGAGAGLIFDSLFRQFLGGHKPASGRGNPASTCVAYSTINRSRDNRS